MKKIISSTIIALIIPFLSPCQNWQGLGTGMNDEVRCLYSDTATNTLYAGGNFSMSSGITTWGVAKWNGTSWDSLGHGLLNCIYSGTPVFSVIRYKNEIYEGGNGMAKWNGTNWVSVGGGVSTNGGNGAIGCFFILNNELYVGGVFDTAGNIAANGIAKWNDTVWADVGAFPNNNLFPAGNPNRIYAITYYNGEIYIGGNFRDSTGNTMNIARWNGTSWNAVGGGFHGGTDQIGDMTVYNNELYVSGSFTTAHGNVGNYIQKWNGTTWSDVGGGVSFAIRKLTVFHNKLYAGGVFSFAGGIPAQCIATWDGTNWCNLGSSYISDVSAICEYNDSLYIGGGFITIDTDTLNRIAKWVGGNYTDTCGHINVGINEIAHNTELEIYPNPVNDIINIDVNDFKNTYLIIYDNIGRLVTKQKLITKTTQLNIASLSKGMYFLQLQNEDKILNKKLIKD